MLHSEVIMIAVFSNAIGTLSTYQTVVNLDPCYLSILD